MILRMTYYKEWGFQWLSFLYKKSLSKLVPVNMIDCIIMIDAQLAWEYLLG